MCSSCVLFHAVPQEKTHAKYMAKHVERNFGKCRACGPSRGCGRRRSLRSNSKFRISDLRCRIRPISKSYKTVGVVGGASTNGEAQVSRESPYFQSNRFFISLTLRDI